ncbi:MAG: hypothetical protein R3E31_27885 [Chloroflexota bacterium]|nr:hypothetical protein [Ardenticatenaceae bacterium]
MKKQALFVLLIVFAIPQLVFAAEETVGVNPPGWLGGLLALLALALAVGLSAWVRNKKL